MCYIQRLYSDDTGLCESVRLLALLQLVCAKSNFCSFLSCLDRNELLRHVRRAACDVFITSVMTVRSFNDSVLKETYKTRGVFRSRQLPRAIDLKERLLSCQSY